MIESWAVSTLRYDRSLRSSIKTNYVYLLYIYETELFPQHFATLIGHWMWDPSFVLNAMGFLFSGKIAMLLSLRLGNLISKMRLSHINRFTQAQIAP